MHDLSVPDRQRSATHSARRTSSAGLQAHHAQPSAVSRSADPSQLAPIAASSWAALQASTSQPASSTPSSNAMPSNYYYQLYTAYVNQAQTTAAQQAARLSAPTESATPSRPPPPAAQRQARPAQPQHRVYLLYCAHCDMFLTDRGMRAVLLLRPSITLFSTDAHPSNCGACLVDAYDASETAQRTCDCLTQTMCCHGCGSSIGYHIVQPCYRCSDSVTEREQDMQRRQDRNANGPNGHRFVFHCGEVRARERRYIEGEAGIVPSTSSRRVRTASNLVSSSTSEYAPANHGRSFSIASEKEGHPLEDVGITLHAQQALNRPPRSSRSQCPGSLQEAAMREGDSIYWHMLRNSGERPPPQDPSQLPKKLPVCIR